MDRITEQKKVELFQMWLVQVNPKIGTCIQLFRAIDKFIDYKLTTAKILQDYRHKMEQEFSNIMEHNFNKEE